MQLFSRPTNDDHEYQRRLHVDHHDYPANYCQQNSGDGPIFQNLRYLKVHNATCNTKS